MAINLAAFKAVGDKFKAAYEKLNQLVASGAVQKDIDDQKAVVQEVLDQVKEIASA